MRGDHRNWWRPLAWGCAVGLGCWGVFVALYPFLWAAPAERAIALFQHRQDEMRQQQLGYPAAAVYDPSDRLGLVLDHALARQTWARGALGIPLDVLLAALGLVSLAAIARRDWRGARRVGPAAVLLMWLLTYLAGVAWGYSLNWPRYVMPLFLLAALLSGLGAESLLRWLGARYAWRDMFAPRGSDGDLERATVGTDRPAHVPNARPPSHRRRPRRGHPLPHHG
ncbi:MAG: hypothetical protein M3513_04150 [Actinomycetota bacterium]|nr:hypothetical protein [Chloroflexota bacterium]MDQ3454659.1 hypothetical protein [Actinomycetota bacterium]